MTLRRAAADRVLGPVVPASELPGPLPEGVVVRRGGLLPAIGGVLARLGGPAAAVTLGRTIVLAPGVPASRRLVAHELAHVRQWRADRLFPLRYAVETLRRGYRDNRYERAAREAEGAPPPREP